MLFNTLLLATLFATAQAALRPVLFNCECRVGNILDGDKTASACRGAGQLRNGVCVVMQHKIGDFVS
ncbi:hypothetical protein CGRA01v4_03981 [Colletotrichum graminicola]|nr:hypothetical protein CGRA01v4_03981 [Colletotrichum graminicola]